MAVILPKVSSTLNLYSRFGSEVPFENVSDVNVIGDIWAFRWVQGGEDS